MHVEVTVALNFVISYLYNKLPRRRVDGFGEELERGLKRKFAGHWYPEKPFRGSAFRCIRVSGDEMDPVMERSATKCGLDIDEVREYLPKDLTIWIDPGEVSYRIGEKGAVKILYSNKRPDGGDEAAAVDSEVQNASRGFNPEAQSFRPIDSLSSSLTNLSLSPSPSGWPMSASPTGGVANPLTSSTSPVTSFLNRNSNATTFTAAAFAATKFGSTKLKCQAKRPSRLSPTDFGAYVKQRTTGFQLPSPGQHPVISNGGFYGAAGHGLGSPIQAPHARSLSPRDLRQDLVEQQQHRLFLMQQQQQQQQQAFSRQQSPQHQQQQQHQQPVQPPSSLLLGSSGLVNSTNSSIGDLYHSAPQSAAASPTSSKLDLFQSPGKGSAPNLQGTPSPTEPNKTFLDSFAWNTLPPYGNLQHLLVAN